MEDAYQQHWPEEPQRRVQLEPRVDQALSNRPTPGLAVANVMVQDVDLQASDEAEDQRE